MMHIEITRPEVEALILDRIGRSSGADPQEIIFQALQQSELSRQTGAALVEAMQASPYKEIDIEPSRVRLNVRDVEL